MTVIPNGASARSGAVRARGRGVGAGSREVGDAGLPAALRATTGAMQPRGVIRLHKSDLIDGEIFVHGFPERTGGVSGESLRASLNMGLRRGGGDMDAVRTNRRLLAEHMGFAVDKLVVTKHVHGAAVWRVGEPLPEPPEFDGLVSDVPGVMLGAFAADCIPMVLADAAARVCGAAHSGWRGTVAGVAGNVVKRMADIGCRPADVRVALGPSIGPCCFEVGPEVVAAFVERFGDFNFCKTAASPWPMTRLYSPWSKSLSRVATTEIGAYIRYRPLHG